MAEAFIGEIRMVGFNFPPKGWATCDGQSLTIAQNTALFSIIGTVYGGNGTTNFSLPDLQGRLPIHVGQGVGLSPYSLGTKGGNENEVILTSHLPVHNHGGALLANAAPGTSTDPSGKVPATPGSSVNARFAKMYSNAPVDTLNTTAIASEGQAQPLPHSNVMPYLCVNFVICLSGTYPTRS
jgi:microcystin-dependent protein